MNFIKSKLRFLNEVMGAHAKSADGVNYAFRCPACSSPGATKKKLVIRLDNDHFHCWVCDYRGRRLTSLFRRYFPAALAKYQSRFLGKKIKSSDISFTPEAMTVSLPQNFVLLSTNMQNSIDPDIKAVISYAHRRGIDDKDMWYFKFGTCTTGKYRRRLIMPSFDADGKLNYLVARSIDSTNSRKYLNARVPKKDIIFNEINVRWDKELTLLEGPLDLINANYNAGCLLGSSLTESYAMFKKIVKNKTPVLLALDPDATTKSHKIARLLSSYGIPTRILGSHDYGDVGEMPRAIFKQLQSDAQLWSEKDRLFHLIGGIKSGSIF